MGYWEKQLSRQAEQIIFHLCFLTSKMCKGVHKQLRILKVKAPKFTTSVSGDVAACLWRRGVKHRNGSVKIPPHNSQDSQGSHNFLPTLCPTSSFLSLYPKPLFSLLSSATAALQHKESSFISTLPWAPAAKLPVCLWGQLVIFCVSVRLCVFIESRKEHSLLFRCQLDLVVAAVGKARISLWVVNWTTCYGAAEGD